MTTHAATDNTRPSASSFERILLSDHRQRAPSRFTGDSRHGQPLGSAWQPIMGGERRGPPEIAKVAYHDPAKFGAGTPPPTPDRIAMMRANQATLAVFAGDPYCYDPTLLSRLQGIHISALVLWGVSDHVVTKEYGRAYAAAIPNATFETVAAAGHLPWLEQPAETFRMLDRFVTAPAAPVHR